MMAFCEECGSIAQDRLCRSCHEKLANLPQGEELRRHVLEYLMKYEGVTGSVAVKAADDFMDRIERWRSKH